MEKLNRTIALWRVMSVCYAVLIFLSFLPITPLLQLTLEGECILDKNWINTTGYLVLASLFFTFITLCLRTILIKRSSSNLYRSPCRIELALHNDDDVISLLGKSVRIEQIDDNCWFGEANKWRSLRLFVYSFKDYYHDADIKKAQEYVTRVNEKTGFPDNIDYEMHQKMGRVQLFLYDKVPKKVMDPVVMSVENCIRQPEFLVNVFIGMDDGVMYIPFCCSRIIGVGKLYQYAVSKIADWFDA